MCIRARQSLVRRVQAEALAHQRYKALGVLQVACRMWLRRISALQVFEKERNTSLVLQCHVRRLQAMSFVTRRSMAATAIQHACRSWLRHRRSIRMHRIESAIISKCERHAKADLSLLLQDGNPPKAKVGICVSRLVSNAARAESASVKRASFTQPAAAALSPAFGSADQFLPPIAKGPDD